MKNYDQLKQVIQEANPGIMDLKFGCEVLKGDVRTRVVGLDGRVVFFSPLINNQNTEFVEHLTILGRPIRLADVLLAIHKADPANKTNVTLESDGQFKHEVYDSKNPQPNGQVTSTIYSKSHWNLRDDNIDNQSWGCKQFLVELLVKDK